MKTYFDFQNVPDRGFPAIVKIGIVLTKPFSVSGFERELSVVMTTNVRATELDKRKMQDVYEGIEKLVCRLQRKYAALAAKEKRDGKRRK